MTSLSSLRLPNSPQVSIATARLFGLCLFVALLASALSGCKAKRRDEHLVEPGTSRPYRVVAPPKPTGEPEGPRPVLFALHPFQTAPEAIVDCFKLIELAVDQRGFLLVVPEGKKDSAGRPHWNASVACCGDGPRADDVAYLKAVLSDVAEHYVIDPKRVYAFGMSNGGFMAQRWACDPAGDLAAVVSLAGAASGPDDPPCAPTRPVSLIEVHGTKDDLVPYEGLHTGTQRHPSARETVASWVELDKADPKGIVTHRKSKAGEDIEIETWKGPSASVSLWTVHGATHLLPSAEGFVRDLFTLYDR